jgi:hypothetical protein
LKPAEVGGLAHLSTQSVDFPSQVALGKASNRRIAGHLTDGIQIDGQKEGLAAHSRGRQCRFDPGMAGSDYNDIIPLRIDEHAVRVLIPDQSAILRRTLE